MEKALFGSDEGVALNWNENDGAVYAAPSTAPALTGMCRFGCGGVKGWAMALGNTEGIECAASRLSSLDVLCPGTTIPACAYASRPSSRSRNPIGSPAASFFGAVLAKNRKT